MKERRSVHQTQWAAQYAVASELCKRDYQVALTLGNHPIVDLMVQSPSSQQFSIDVKGLYKPNFWAVKPKELREDLFYVLAYVPSDKPNEFFVLTQQQVNDAIRANWDKYCAKHGLVGSDVHNNRFPGIEWKSAESYRDRWDVLPR